MTENQMLWFTGQNVCPRAQESLHECVLIIPKALIYSFGGFFCFFCRGGQVFLGPSAMSESSVRKSVMDCRLLCGCTGKHNEPILIYKMSLRKDLKWCSKLASDTRYTYTTFNNILFDKIFKGLNVVTLQLPGIHYTDRKIYA